MTLYGLTDNDVRTLRQMAHAFRTGALNLSPYRARGKGGSFGLTGLFTPCRCTAEDSGGAGLHTFSEVDWEGNEVVGGRVFYDVWCVGDFDKDWDLATGFASGTFGLVFKVGSQNVAIMTHIGAYYAE